MRQPSACLFTFVTAVCKRGREESPRSAAIAGILSWLYVIYFAMTRRADETK
jgi:hypothetical protein